MNLRPIHTRTFVLSLLITMMLGLCSCGGKKEDPIKIKFKNDIENFCNSISELDASMNVIDPTSDNAPAQLLQYLDEVDMRFKAFAELDFPEEYDYLESLADEASTYMTEAVTYYHSSYSNDSYNEYTAEYAQENYARAIKRIKIIIAMLRGETPQDAGITISYEGTE